MRITIILLLIIPIVGFGQATWHEITTPTDQPLNCIQFIDDQAGYIGGHETLLKTQDGGLSWSIVAIDSLNLAAGTGINLLDMHWFDEQHGIIMLGWAGSFETYDGGISWSSVPTTNGFCQKSSICFLDEDQGFIGGSGCFFGQAIERFENNAWFPANVNPLGDAGSNWISTIEFMNPDTGFAGTYDGVLLRTIDGGLNWDTITNPSAGQMITDFVFEGNGVIRATHRNSQWGVMISDDYGLTWDWDSETATFFYPRMNAGHKDNNGTTYLGGIEGNLGTIGVIFDNSAGWWNYGNVGAQVNDITSIQDSTTFLVCDSGRVFVNVDPSTLTNIEVQEKGGFEVWPNPFSGEVNISSLSETAHLQVLDSFGRMVFQDQLTSSESRINLKSLSAGTYFIIFNSDRELQSKKLIKQK